MAVGTFKFPRVAKVKHALPIATETRPSDNFTIGSLDLTALVLRVLGAFGLAIDRHAVQHLRRVDDLAASVTCRKPSCGR